jgi:hypothetical protein
MRGLKKILGIVHRSGVCWSVPHKKLDLSAHRLPRIRAIRPVNLE